MSHNTSGISRRHIVRGAAWAAPAVTVAAAAPAVAASTTCTTEPSTTGAANLNADTSGTTATDVQFLMGGTVTLTNLPDGVTVTSITQKYVIECVAAPGATDGSTGPGAGWSDSVQNSYAGDSIAFPDGTSREAWDLTFSWDDAVAGSGTYTDQAGPCQNFTSSDLGQFAVNYPQLAGMAAGSGNCVDYFTNVTAELSDGTTITYQSPVGTVCP
ncbi:hypothetical protein [Kytococcus sp. Marseille-QA3725]